MDLSTSSGRRGRSVALLVAGILAGSVMIQPAVAHVTRKLNHLYKHLDPRYVNVGETVGQATNAANLGGTPASGYAKVADLQVRSQDDGSGSSASFALTQFNSVPITVPTSGFLMISGQANINNNDTAAGFAQLDARVDGTSVAPLGIVAAQEVTADANGTDDAPLAYTVVHPVTAGSHTVTQFGTGGTLSWSWFAAELTVTFWPTGSLARGVARGTPSMEG